MSPPPLVSAVIPTYNRVDVLDEAIESVQSQTYGETQIIVVDDGSTDRTAKLLEEYPNVKYHRQENQGANAARNRGVELADGEFIAFLDADDKWVPEKIERQVAVFDNASEDCALVHTGIERRGFDGELIDRVIPPTAHNPKRRLLLGNYVGTFSSVMVRSQVFDRVGLLDEDLPSWQDWEFYLRVADEFDFERISDLLTIKRSGKNDQISRDLSSLVDTTYPFFEARIESEAEEFGTLFRRKAIARLRMEVGDAALLNRNAALARVFLFRGLVSYPFDPELFAYFLLSLGGIKVYDAALGVKRAVTA